jgi:hypothetical protein
MTPRYLVRRPHPIALQDVFRYVGTSLHVEQEVLWAIELDLLLPVRDGYGHTLRHCPPANDNSHYPRLFRRPSHFMATA